MSAWTSSNGLTNTLNYDTDGRLTGISVPSKQSLAFAYDNTDRITQITNGIDNTLTQNFGYDYMSRLTSVYSGADNEIFGYNANGGRTSWTTNGASFTDTISSTSNQLQTVNGGISYGYGYDANGNSTNIIFTPEYHYNAFNRMDSSPNTTYYVNPEGQRLRKIGSSGTSYFAPSQSGSLLAESQGSGWTDYVWLNGRLIGRMANGQVDAVHDDQVGRPEAVTDASQNVVWRAQNFAFSQKIIVSNITFNLGFPGMYYDTETATWNNGYRDYVPNEGRYLESDPSGLAGGINTYAYVGGNPLSNVDPTGLMSPTMTLALGRAGAAEVVGGGPEDPVADVAAVVVFAGTLIVGANSVLSSRPPPGSLPISDTPWSGDHGSIKTQVGAGPADNVKIDPDGNVWVQNPDGSWTDYGPASDYTGSGKPSGRKGKDRGC